MTLATDDLLGGKVPVRADDFTFKLIDANGADAGTLDVVSDSPPTMRFDTARTMMRTLTNLTIARSDFHAIDLENERLAVKMLLQNGDVFDLGTLMFGQDNQALSSWGNAMTPELFDEMFLVDQALDETVSVPAGASARDVVTVLLAPFPDLPVVFDAADVLTTAPLTFALGSSRYDALKAVADLLGCYPPFIDNRRRLRFKLPRATDDATVDHVYEAGARLLDEGQLQLTSSAYKAPNKFVVSSGDPTSPIVGSYILPDSAPHSIANRKGRVVTHYRTVNGIASVEAANQAAYVDALTDTTAYGRIKFGATADPRHDGFDVLWVLGVRYLETAWDLVLESGGDHTHEGTTLWSV